MVPTDPALPALIGPIPGGPELLIIFMLFFMLLIPAAVFAAGVGVGWWLRGRNGGQPREPTQIPENDTQVPENDTQVPENDTQVPENDTQTPENQSQD